MENKNENPYAPPKTMANDGENITYLEQDGYSAKDELVSNEHFKSPPICAKLGIAINENEIKPTPVTIIRKLILPKFLFTCFTILLFLGLISFLSSYSDRNIPPTFALFAIVFIFTFVPALRYLLSRPYQISFYLSDQYLKLRKRRKILYTTALVTLLLFITYGVQTNKPVICGLSILGILIIYIISQFKMSKFTVTHSNDEFHYIRGVHQNLLDALPPLPLTSQRS